ncbi:competence protein CoiA family protein [Bacillus sp. REN3]|uniref:competence protein CoiA n=1 Tax=Bacillus sp. REN3 TaxID=2802440 RepID=UPI001AEDC241
MLIANRKSGEKLSLAERWKKEELSAIRNKEKFYCPECNEEVILKLGSKRIWHFSHQAGSSCESQYERESDYHLSGKLKLFEWLVKQGIDAELEKFDPLVRQKPDIAFSWNGKKYALEYQCSVIPEELFIKRTVRYLENGYIPIWIAAGSLIKRAGAHTFSLSPFLYLFLRRTDGSWTFPAFCPITEQFIHLHSLLPVSSRRAIATPVVSSLSKSSIRHLIMPTFPSKPFLKQWKAELQRFKARYMKYPSAYGDPFLRELYEHRLNIHSLPPEIGLPLFSGIYIETPSLIWQAYLYLDVFRYLKKGESVEYSDIRAAFLKRINRQQIRFRKLPNHQGGNGGDVLDEYLLLLTELSILRKINPQRLKMIEERTVQLTVEEQMRQVDRFYQKIEKTFREVYKLASERGK